jgi:hypothetical protein
VQIINPQIAAISRFKSPSTLTHPTSKKKKAQLDRAFHYPLENVWF